MPGPIPLSFDITDSLPPDAAEGRGIAIAGWLFFPDDLALLGDRPVTITPASYLRARSVRRIAFRPSTLHGDTV